MLIKVYTTANDIVIIEGVTDICIKEGLKEYSPWVPRADDGYHDVCFDPLVEGKDHVAREITYVKDGPKRLYLLKRAYVCNDEGKTIHTVETGVNVIPF